MDFQKAIELIEKSTNILITTHVRPDGDACGSVAAMYETMTALGKKAKVLLLSELPDWYQFLFSEKPAILGDSLTLEQLKAGQFIKPDLIIIVDTNSGIQLPKFYDYLKQNDMPVLVIDHHATSDHLGNIELLDVQASAAGLIVHELFKCDKWPIKGKTAEALFVAIATDTGWFRFTNVDSRTLRSCAELMDLGIKPPEIYHLMYQNFSYQRFRLMITLLDSLELHFDGRYASQQLVPADFSRTGAALKDTENLIDECQRISTVEVASVFVELPDGRIKCSLRSKKNVDVRKITQKFGGGGHAMASGTYLPGPLENAKKLILEEVREQLGAIDRS